VKISIITATYNSAATVRDTLESVSRQDYSDIEHIIIDGLSKDETLDVVSDFPHVSRSISEKDGGIYDAMNKGINMTKGDIVGILNSDDFYADEKVLSRVAKVFQTTGCEAVYADLQYVDKKDVTRVKRNWRSGSYKPGSFEWGWMPPHPTFFVRRELYEKFGLFNLSLRSAADYELMLRFIHRHKVKLEYIPAVIVKMRMGGVSNSSVFNRFKASREDRMAWEINSLKPNFFTFFLKPARKLGQYI
jgi:glycosyltransferase involved in cell wall biosynthesis